MAKKLQEKRLRAISSRLFLADGSATGEITIASTRPFKVKQEVIISATGLPNLELEVKSVNNPTQLIVGPRSGNINARTDVSSYTTILSAAIFANEQKRPSIPFEEVTRAVYDEEPTIANRSVLVDQDGEYIDSIEDNTGTRRLAVDTVVNVGNLSVTIQEPTDPEVVNVNIASANTEYPFTLPTKTQRFSLKIRGSKSSYKLRTTSGSSNYFSYSFGNTFDSGEISVPAPKTLYVECSDTCVVEIFCWKLP
jgi:hypothetical protein